MLRSAFATASSTRHSIPYSEKIESIHLCLQIEAIRDRQSPHELGPQDRHLFDLVRMFAKGGEAEPLVQQVGEFEKAPHQIPLKEAILLANDR